MVTWLGATSLLVGGWLGVAWATSSPTKPRWLADRGGNAVVLVGGGHGEIGRFPVTRPVRVAVEPGGDRGVVASAVADYALGDHEVFWCEPDGTRLVTWATPAVRDLDVARGVAAWVTIGVAEPACLCLGRPGGGQSARGLSRLPTAQSPRSLAFDAAGEHLLVGCEGGRLELWSVGSLTRVNELVDPGAQWDDVVPAARGGWFALDANGGRVVRLDRDLATSWSRVTGLSPASLTPSASGEDVWVVDTTQPVVRRLDQTGEIELTIPDLPLAGFDRSVPTSGDGLFFLAPGATLELDRFGDLIGSQGGYRFLVDVAH